MIPHHFRRQSHPRSPCEPAVFRIVLGQRDLASNLLARDLKLDAEDMALIAALERLAETQTQLAARVPAPALAESGDGRRGTPFSPASRGSGRWSLECRARTWTTRWHGTHRR